MIDEKVDPVGAVKEILDAPTPVLLRTPFKDGAWQEVTSAPGEALVLIRPEDYEEYLPDLYVVYGSQMWKVIWPTIPHPDPSKTAMR